MLILLLLLISTCHGTHVMTLSCIDGHQFNENLHVIRQSPYLMQFYQDGVPSVVSLHMHSKTLSRILLYLNEYSDASIDKQLDWQYFLNEIDWDEIAQLSNAADMLLLTELKSTLTNEIVPRREFQLIVKHIRNKEWRHELKVKHELIKTYGFYSKDVLGPTLVIRSLDSPFSLTLAFQSIFSRQKTTISSALADASQFYNQIQIHGLKTLNVIDAPLFSKGALLDINLEFEDINLSNLLDLLLFYKISALDLSFATIKHGQENILEKIKETIHLDSLESLYLQHVEWETPLLFAFLEKCGSGLKKLYLNGNPSSFKNKNDYDRNHIQRLFIKFQELDVLNMGRNGLDSSFITRTLLPLKHLKGLYLYSNNINDLKPFHVLLDHFTELKVLDFSENPLTTASLIFLFDKMLPRMTKLNLLRLQQVNLNDELLIQLILFLKQQNSITYLSLERNPIGNAGARALVDFLNSCDAISLQELSMNVGQIDVNIIEELNKQGKRLGIRLML